MGARYNLSDRGDIHHTTRADDDGHDDIHHLRAAASMSADFWAGYISGAVGIVIGNPLDILKVRLQAQSSPASGPSPPPPPPPPAAAPTSSAQPSPASQRPRPTSLSLLSKFSTGTAAPILGYGALNALLFVSYNRSEALLNQAFPSASSGAQFSGAASATTGTNLWTTFIAGAIGGLATWAVSTPTELIKCRAQLAAYPHTSSWAIAKQIWRAEGALRGLYFGGTVTAIRDSVGYGFYFWSYELSTRWVDKWSQSLAGPGQGESLPSVAGFTGVEAARVLLCGGIAGIVTWASIFPLDVIKTRVQAQVYGPSPTTGEGSSLLRNPDSTSTKRLGAIEIAKQTYRDGGFKVFFRGLTVCSVRAFIVNAVQWATYEWIMMELGHGRKNRELEPRLLES